MRSTGHGDDAVSLGGAVVLRSTDKALFCEVHDLGESIWIPRSVIHDDSEVYDDDHDGELVVKSWWAHERGFA